MHCSRACRVAVAESSTVNRNRFKIFVFPFFFQRSFGARAGAVELFSGLLSAGGITRKAAVFVSRAWTGQREGHEGYEATRCDAQRNSP